MKYKLIETREIPDAFLSPFESSKKEGLELMDWFTTIKKSRLQQLMELNDISDFKKEKIAKVEDFFKKNINQRVRTDQEVLGEKSKLQDKFKHLEIDDKTLDDVTVSLCFDVGIYVGEVFRKISNSLYWGVPQENRQSINFNQICVLGFKHNKQFNIRRMMEIHAEKILEGGQHRSLTELFNVWEKKYIE